MRIRSPDHRLRLFLLSLSLFCFDAAMAQSTSRASQPLGGEIQLQKISSPPDIEVVSHNWIMNIFKPAVATGPAISSETIQKSERVNDPMPVQVPNPNLSATPIERQWYIYSAVILNRGQKNIKALKWSYVFSDPVTHEELKRQRGFGDVTIHPAEKKTLQIRTPLSPPRVVNASAPNAASPFEERVIIECVLFADRSLWTNPQAKEGLCDNLRDYKR